MDPHYFYSKVLPVVIFFPIVMVVLAYLSFRFHASDHFFEFLSRPIRETRDFYRIKQLLLKCVSKDLMLKHLSDYAIERIEGAAEKAVPHIREHGKIELQLPGLFKVNGMPKNVNLKLELKELRSRNWEDIVK